ncbi:MAG TPA: ATP-binding protein [Gemmatimonadaceae bacterium]|nr:ATP-binding protein [Gemmatimonadaceae bacterium]
MTSNTSVVTAIEAAVTGDPTNWDLRLHLAELMLGAGRAADALSHAGAVLGARPADTAALALAARAAEGAGDPERSAAYRRLHEALAGGGVRQPAREAVAQAAPAPPSAPPSAPPLTGEPGRLRLVRDAGDAGASVVPESERPDVTLADVAGMEAVKRRLNLAFLAPLRNPEMMRMYGKSLRGGLLLYGPPGCGKTFIARATAGEMGARFIPVGLSDVLDMYIGQSERNLHEIFEAARRKAPCVLFFDEVDALGRKRSLQRHSGGRDVVNQLLAEMDSVASNNDGVFILAATNHPWDVDSALRRPGRLDRTLLVLPPDEPARRAIIGAGLAGRPAASDVDAARLARKTEGYSGADVAHLCDSAAELAMEASLEAGEARPIRGADFARALKDVKPSTGPWFDTARHYAMYANEGGAYDELLEYLRARRMI